MIKVLILVRRVRAIVIKLLILVITGRRFVFAGMSNRDHVPRGR